MNLLVCRKCSSILHIEALVNSNHELISVSDYATCSNPDCWNSNSYYKLKHLQRKEYNYETIDEIPAELRDYLNNVVVDKPLNETDIDEINSFLNGYEDFMDSNP